MRYGDSFALPLTKLRHLSGKHQTPGHEHISGKHICSEMAEKIRQERRREESWDKLPRAVKHITTEPESPTTGAVYPAYQSLGFEPIRMLWAIRRSAERNMTVHADVAEMIKNGQWMSLGELVYRDLQEVHCLLPEGCEEDTEHLTAVLEELLDTYLDRRHGHRDTPGTWGLSRVAVREDSEKRRRGIVLRAMGGSLHVHMNHTSANESRSHAPGPALEFMRSTTPLGRLHRFETADEDTSRHFTCGLTLSPWLFFGNHDQRGRRR